ncbi:MAG: M1 family peptidase [Bacteroidetes bacterium]|jgi:hypothetical protein|nr:M1 family peptidase [Bacteroidota bacterium]
MLRLLGSLLLLLALCPGHLAAQTAADWQQRVQYEMDVTLHTERHQMDGVQRLTYVNNSPDTLRQVFYHLYFNAFQPTSMMAERNRHLPDADGRVVPRIFNLGPDEVGYHRVDTLTQDGQPVRFTITDTVLRADLARPLAPGDTTVFRMVFHSQVPLQTRRSGRDNREGIDYSMTQWYPKLAQYDETGWHADPYVGREFYAPFGTFDVRLRLPAPYVIGGTGVLQNPNEIGHGYQTDSTATVTHAPTDTLTWHFRAENVHDFAWAADPDYLHDRITDDRGTTYHLLYQPDVAETWQRLKTWTPEIIQYMSDQFGPYPYPQFTVVQGGDGGMEYPMATLITGRRSPRSLLGVTAHEAGHMWYHSVLGFNEADYAWMDEGFTSYASRETVSHIMGRANPSHQGNQMRVVALKHFGLFERLNTPADWFATNAAYGTAAYPGGAALVETLGYVMSDSLRDAWLLEFFDRYAFQHPNPWDAQKTAEDVSGLRLDWLFEQLTNTTRRLDYAVVDLDSRPGDDGWTSTIHLRRAAEVAMPVDLRVTMADDATRWVTIPLGIMQGHKPVPDDWTVAEPWLWTFPDYTMTLDTPAEVVDVEIDPLGKTPEQTRLNNTARFPVEVDFFEAPGSSWFDYEIGWRPLANYAADFGPGVGLRAAGSYFLGQHRTEAMVTLWPQVLFSGGDDPELSVAPGSGDDLTAFDGVDYEVVYADQLTATPRLTGTVRLQKHLGVLQNTVGLRTQLSGYRAPATQTARVDLVHQYIPSDRTFTIDAFPWFQQEHLLSGRFGYRIDDGSSWIEAGLELGVSLVNPFECRDAQNQPVACAIDQRQSATRFMLDAGWSHRVDRFVGQARMALGLGVDNLAFQKRFRLGTPTVEDAWQNAASRSLLGAFDDPLADAHLTAFSGAGPVAYLLAAAADSLPGRPIGGTPLGTRMVGGTLSISTQPFPDNRWLRPLRAEVFSGLGTTWGRSTFAAPDDGDGTIGFDADHLIADAGLGIMLDAARLPVLDDLAAQSDVLSNLQLALKLPLWVSDPALIGETNEVDFRWLIGLQVQP